MGKSPCFYEPQVLKIQMTLALYISKSCVSRYPVNKNVLLNYKHYTNISLWDWDLHSLMSGWTDCEGRQYHDCRPLQSQNPEEELQDLKACYCCHLWLSGTMEIFSRAQETAVIIVSVCLDYLPFKDFHLSNWSLCFCWFCCLSALFIKAWLSELWSSVEWRGLKVYPMEWSPTVFLEAAQRRAWILMSAIFGIKF